MPIYEFTSAGVSLVKETNFGLAGLQERRDLQRMLREQIEVIAPDTLVLSEEFGDWDDSRRRIDLLALDKNANLVVIELKRTEDGGHMELQALRYAAMVSTMTFEQAVAVFGRYLQKIDKSSGDAREVMLDFLGWGEPNEDSFGKDVRIVLASAEFSKELTSSVLWLIEHGLDITCMRMKPYSLADRLLVDVQQIVPLPDAVDYQFQVREKAQRAREDRVSHADFTRFDVRIGDEVHTTIWKRNALYLICKYLMTRGVVPDEIDSLVTWRTNTFYSVEGSVDTGEFERLAVEKARSEGRSFDAARWFCEDNELFHADGNTYALSKMWGGENWHKAMNLLKDRYPEYRIEFSPTT